MAEIRGIQALKLSELLSAPMVAMVQADVLAARATVDFVEAVGFVPEKEGDEKGKLGRLRMAEFRYRKVDENGVPSEFEVAIPLLSLVPIPSIQIKQARVGLSAKITDVVTEKTNSPSPAGLAGLKARRFDIVAKPVSSSGTKGQEVRSSYDLEVEITLGQADITVGMEKVFQLLDQAVRETKTGS